MYNSQSDPIAIESSVPQGSVLGPIWFIAYVEDADDLLSSPSFSHHFFADDTQYSVYPGVKRFAAACNLRPGSAVVVCVASPAIECSQNWTDGLILVPLFVIYQLACPSKSGLLLYHLLTSFEIWMYTTR